MKRNPQPVVGHLASSRQLTKQQSSPLLGQFSQFSAFTAYEGLEYSRKRNVQHHKLKNQKTSKKMNPKQQPMIVPAKNIKQTIPVFEKISPVSPWRNSHNILSPIMRKSKVEPWQKQKKHYYFSHINPNPQHSLHSQSPPNPQNYSLTRYKKIINDFDDRIGYGCTGYLSEGGVNNVHQEGKRHRYRLNMFKESYLLGIQGRSQFGTRRRPCVFRNQSLIQLG